MVGYGSVWVGGGGFWIIGMVVNLNQEVVVYLFFPLRCSNTMATSVAVVS
jgi:hypothetical protein